MRHPLTNRQQRELIEAKETIKKMIGVEYPESEVDMEEAFQQGVGDGFRLALDGLVNAALPGWKSR